MHIDIILNYMEDLVITTHVIKIADLSRSPRPINRALYRDKIVQISDFCRFVDD
jgi:hypothetical protein